MRTLQVLSILGINSVTDYCWIHYLAPRTFPLTDYVTYAEEAIAQIAQHTKEIAPVPYVRLYE